MTDVIQNGPIIQSFRRHWAVIAKITREFEDLADGRGQHCFHCWAVAPYPRRKSKSGAGGTTHVYQGNIDAVLATFEASTSLVVLSCFDDAVTALA